MIVVTRLNGPTFLLNPDLIERVESTPDTVVTLVNGTKYVVAEPVDEVAVRVRTHRAEVLVAAEHLSATGPVPRSSLRLVDGDPER